MTAADLVSAVPNPPAPVEGPALEYVPASSVEIQGLEVERKCVEITMLDGDPTILVGHTGAGKTRLLQNMHHEAGWPYRTIGGHGRVEVHTLIGKPWIEPDGTMTYKLGVLPFCMKYGIAVGFQEINAVAPDVLIMLHEFLDEGHITLQDAPMDFEDFVIEPHPNFRLYGTMNPPELYPGTKELSPALVRRCLVRRVGHLSPEQEIAVVVNQTTVTQTVAEQMVKAANDIRAQFLSQQSLFWVSVADVVQWADKTRHLSPIEAAEICVIGKAPTDPDATFAEKRVRLAFDRKATGAEVQRPEDPVAV